MSEELLTAEEVAGKLKVGKRYVTEKLILCRTFPRPVRLPTPKGGKGHPRWRSSDIQCWIEKLAA